MKNSIITLVTIIAVIFIFTVVAISCTENTPDRPHNMGLPNTDITNTIQLEVNGQYYQGLTNDDGYTTLSYISSSITLGANTNELYFDYYVFATDNGEKVTYSIDNHELSIYNINTDIITRIKL